MKSVFLIKTPLQLLNAVEAKYHFNLNTDDCVLIIMGDRKSQPQILVLVEAMNEWGDIIVLNNVSLFFGSPFSDNNSSFLNKFWQSKYFSKSFYNVRRLNKISKCLGEAEYIFLGYARYIYMRHFMNVTPHKKTYILDDGVATIQLAKERKDGFSSSQVGLKKKIKLFSKRFFQRIKDADMTSVSFFTIYDISPGENDTVIRNDFNHIRSQVDLLETTDDVYFLGSPLGEIGVLSQEEHLKHLARVKDYYGDRKLIYIAHRRESAKSLGEIKSMLNFEVLLFEYPIEYQIAMVGPRPKVLASFVSSALDSCHLIFNDKLKITSFRLDLTNTDSEYRKRFESVYDNYESNADDNFTVESIY